MFPRFVILGMGVLGEEWTNFEVQDAKKKGVLATEWANSVSKIVGGKAGGKEPTAIGNGTEPGRVEDAVEAARRYLERFEL